MRARILPLTIQQLRKGWAGSSAFESVRLVVKTVQRAKLLLAAEPGPCSCGLQHPDRLIANRERDRKGMAAMRCFAQRPEAVRRTSISTIVGRPAIVRRRDVDWILHLQRTIGNRGVQRLLNERTRPITPELDFGRRTVQRQPQPKPPTTNAKLVFDEIKKRNPDIAELITPQSINFSNARNPPAIKGGPMKGGEEHVWKVRILAAQAFAGSKIVTGGDERKKVKGGTQVTHFLDVTWALPLAPNPEFIKQTSSANEAFTLSAAEPLYHELLHARIMMENDPNWTQPHTQVFQQYTDIIQIAGSPAVDKERQALKAALGKEADRFYEFLVHEKFDADTEGKAFGRTYSNKLIAEKYSEVVALRMGVDDKNARKSVVNGLAPLAEKLFDKLDQEAQKSKPAQAPPAKQP